MDPGRRCLLGAGNHARTEAIAPPAEDPILKVIGIGEDGELTRDLDRQLHG